MRRGDVVIVSAPGDYGKPRPAIIVQSNQLDEADSVLIALVSSSLTDAPFYRLDLEPSAANGLNARSQVMVDKIVTLPRAKYGPPVGHLDDVSLAALNRMLLVMFGLAD